MQKDKRPGVAAVLKALYPDEGAQQMVQDMGKAVETAAGLVKQDKKTGFGNINENVEEEAVDDPAPAAKVLKPKRGAQSQPQVQVQSRIEVAAPVEKPYTGPRIDKVHNICLSLES